MLLLLLTVVTRVRSSCTRRRRKLIIIDDENDDGDDNIGRKVKLAHLSPNSTWLVSTRHDSTRSTLSSPCILAVSS